MGAAAPHGYKSADAIDRDNENVGVSRHYVYIMNGAVCTSSGSSLSRDDKWHSG